MGMADGTVRMFPYTITPGGVATTGVGVVNPAVTPLVVAPSSIAAFLTPNGGEAVTLPDT